MPHARQHRLWNIDERGCQQQRGHFVQVEHLTSGIDEGAHRTPLASTFTDPWATAARRDFHYFLFATDPQNVLSHRLTALAFPSYPPSRPFPRPPSNDRHGLPLQDRLGALPTPLRYPTLAFFKTHHSSIHPLRILSCHLPPALTFQTRLPLMAPSSQPHTWDVSSPFMGCGSMGV